MENSSVISNINNNNEISVSETPIQNFYRGETILITGGTGFLGKVVIAKLLKNCPDFSRIYMIIRRKRKEDVNERIQKFMTDVIFESSLKENSKLAEKIVGISGDCSKPNLGLDDHNCELLKNEVTVVIHMAATIRFDEKLKDAAAINIMGTSCIIDLCEKMSKLKALMHVSTTYSNCFTKIVEEKFYDYPIKSEELMNLLNAMPDNTINSITSRLINPWPNTYTFTKALAEDLIKKNCVNLPVGILRPGIVISSVSEPSVGWTDSYTGATAIIAGILYGTLRIIHLDPKCVVNFVPVDYTANAILAATWSIAEKYDKKSENIPIFNFTSTEVAPLTFGQLIQLLIKSARKYPSKFTMWYPNLTPITNDILRSILNLLFHWLPVLILDYVAYIRGQKGGYKKIYQKMQKTSDLLSYFQINEWRFKDENTKMLWDQLDSRDKLLFPFNFDGFNWPKHIENYVKGVRIYMFGDDLSSLESSRKKLKRLHTIHQITFWILSILSVWILYSLFSMVI